MEVRARSDSGNVLAIFISGAGGWADIDKRMSKALALEGIPVVGLKALRYFSKQRTPDEAARDLERVLRHYLEAWHKDRVILAGYSRSAEVIPFLADRLPPGMLERVDLVVLLGAAHEANFKFHPSDWFGNHARTSDLPVRQEVDRPDGIRVLCIYGSEEKDTVCKELEASEAIVIALSGGHHFDRDYSSIAQRIVREVREK